MKKFQTVLLIIFGVGAVFAVIVFAGYIPSPKGKSAVKGSGNVVIWGTESSPKFTEYLSAITDGIQDFHIIYIPKDPSTYESDLIEAFAASKGPDIFMVTNSNMMRFSNQIEPISYTVMPQKTFLDTFAPAFSTFLSGKGILAYPFLIDPMVLYYNKTLLANDGIANPPKYWDEVVGMSEKLTKRDATGAFLQSSIPFGRFENNSHAKDIMLLLLTQIGNNVFTINPDGQYVSTLATHKTSLGLSLPAVTTFFTDFASPDTLVYSWNKSLSDATSSFLVERVALYPGFASELFKLQERNPNLALSVTDIPQPRGFTNKKTYANITGLALSRYGTNKSTSILTMQILAGPENSGQFAKTLSLPSAYTADLKTNPDPSLAYQGTLQFAALRAVSFRDPNAPQTLALFRTLTQNILAGGADAEGAYERADSTLTFILSSLNQLNTPAATTTIPTGN